MPEENETLKILSKGMDIWGQPLIKCQIKYVYGEILQVQQRIQTHVSPGSGQFP